MAWIESHQELTDHPKKDALAEALFVGMVPDDIADLAAIGLLQRLWWWALSYAQDGDLSRYTDRQIARGCRWGGDVDSLINAFVKSGFIDGDRKLHDWHEYAGRLIEQRENGRRANAERQRRHRQRYSQDSPKDVTRDVTRDVTEGETGRNGPTYPTQPTIPNQPIKEDVPKPPKVSAPTDTDWQAESDRLLAEAWFPVELEKLGRLLAAENKSGKTTLSKIVRELYMPIVAMQADFSREALRHGIQSAIGKPAPSSGWVKKLAAGYRQAPLSRDFGARASTSINGEEWHRDLAEVYGDGQPT